MKQYAKEWEITLNKESRMKKANKIISILNENCDLSNCKILDIGTGSGYIIHQISKNCKEAYSVDLEDDRKIKEGYIFKKVVDERIPFKDNTFDVVISNYVIEHIPDQKLHLNEIHRVLKKGGILYLGMPNKYHIIDVHYKLPLITWFPRKISKIYFRLVKNMEWDIYPISCNKLKSIVKNKFEINDVTINIIKSPRKYGIDTFKSIQPLIKIIPDFILRIIHKTLPSYILILKNVK